jgi:hypothetical protein
MKESYNLSSILLAIENINDGTKKNTNNFIQKTVTPPITKKTILEPENSSNKNENMSFSTNNGLLPITEKIILEAENYSNKQKNDAFTETPVKEDVLILDKEFNEQNLAIVDLEEIKLNIIDDLYSSLSKNVKKNTLKIIFDLREKINNLEKEVITLTSANVEEEFILDDKASGTNNKEHLIGIKKTINNEEHLIHEDNYTIIEEDLIYGKENNLSEETIKTLKHQNSIIKTFEKNEEKLRIKIVDLEQNITLLSKYDTSLALNLDVIEKENEAEQSTSKAKSESIFFKENYEKLIIENNELKKKLLNTKTQISVFEKNTKELEDGFENLNNILSKNSIIKLK